MSDSIHPFFDPLSMYGQAILNVLREDGEYVSVQEFFEELRCRRLREEWQYEVPESPQDFGYSTEVNQLIYEQKRRSMEAREEALGEVILPFPTNARSAQSPAEAMYPLAAAAAPATNTVLVVLDCVNAEQPQVLWQGGFTELGVEVFSGFSPANATILTDRFILRVTADLAGEQPRQRAQVQAMVFSPYRIEQLSDLDSETKANTERDRDLGELLANSFRLSKLTDFKRIDRNPSIAGRYFDVLRCVPVLTGMTDDRGELEFDVPLLQPSPKLEPGSCVAVCFGP